MKVLVLGGAGFAGSNIARYLNSFTFDVTVMDNLTRYGTHNNLADFQQLGIKFVHGDVRCKEDFRRLDHGYGCVVDCAAQPTAVDGYDNPEYDYTNNTAAVINTLEYIREGHANGLIFFSTNKVYSADKVNCYDKYESGTRYVLNYGSGCNWQYPQGYNPDYGFSEELTLSGGEKSIYGASKAAADIFVREYADAFGIPVIVNRFSCLAGPYQWGKCEQGWVAWWMIAAMLGLPVQYIGWKGKQVRDVLFADDLSALIATQIIALPSYHGWGRVYNVGGGPHNTLSLLEATDVVEKMTGKKLQTSYTEEVRTADHCIYISDIRDVCETFDWKPEIDIKTGYKQIYKWVKKNKKILEAMYK